MPAPARRLSTTVNVNNRTHDHFAKRRGAVSHADQARRSRLGPTTGPARQSIGPGGSARKAAPPPHAVRRLLLNERLGMRGAEVSEATRASVPLQAATEAGRPGQPPRAPARPPPRAAAMCCRATSRHLAARPEPERASLSPRKGLSAKENCYSRLFIVTTIGRALVSFELAALSLTSLNFSPRFGSVSSKCLLYFTLLFLFNTI